MIQEKQLRVTHFVSFRTADFWQVFCHGSMLAARTRSFSQKKTSPPATLHPTSALHVNWITPRILQTYNRQDSHSRKTHTLQPTFAWLPSSQAPAVPRPWDIEHSIRCAPKDKEIPKHDARGRDAHALVLNKQVNPHFYLNGKSPLEEFHFA